MTDPIQPTPDNNAAPVPPAPVSQDAVPKRKKRRWPKVLLALVVLGVLLVVLLPTLLSTSVARNFALGKAAAFIPHGKLEVADWSLGWFSPIRLTGVKLLDDKGQPVFEADEIKTDLTLLKAARQKFELGDTVVSANGQVVIYPDGTNNISRVFATDAAPKPEPKPEHDPKPEQAKQSEPATLPNVSGTITLKLAGDVRVVDSADATTATLRLQPGSGGTIKIADINQPIDTDLKFVVDAGENTKPGTIALKASADAVNANKIDVANVAGSIDLTIIDIDTANLRPILAMAKRDDVRLAGIAAGHLAGELKAGQAGAIKGGFTLTNLEVAAAQLLEPYKANLVEAPISVTRDVIGGVSRLKLDLGVKAPEAIVRVTGDVPEPAIARLQEKKMPGDAGRVDVTADVDFAKLAAALPNTLRVPANVTVDRGTLASVVTLTLAADNIVADVKTDVSLQGKKDGKPIAIEPVKLTSSAKLTTLENSVAGLRDLKANLASAFAHFDASGTSVAMLNGKGDADLAKAIEQAAQFVDLGKMSLAGQAKFDLTSRGDSANPTAMKTTLNGTVTGLNVTLPDQPAIDLPLASIKAAANLTTDAGGVNVLRIESLTADILAGDSEQKPLLTTNVVGSAIDIKTKQFTSITADIAVDLVQANRFAKAFAGEANVPTATAGKFGGKLTAAALPGKNMTASFVGALNALSLSETPVQNETLSIDLNAIAPSALDRVQAGLIMRGNLMSVVARNISVRVPAKDVPVPAFKQVETADIEVSSKDLAKLATVATALVPNLKLPVKPAGGFAVTANVKNSKADVSLTASRLVVTNDAGKAYAFDAKKPVTLKLTAVVEGDQTLDGVRIDTLAGDFDVATVSLAEPLVVKNLATSPTASGKITLAGVLDRVMPLLQVVQGAEKPMPYGGRFSFTQAIAPKGKGGAIGLVGTGTIDDFTVLDDAGKTAFTEKQVTIVNDLAVDTATQMASITKLSLDMAASKAAQINVTGGVEKWTAERILKDVTVKVDAVGPKVWPIVFSFLPPAQQTQFKDLKLDGPVTFNLLANGSYPVKPTWNESVKTVVAYGDVFVKGIDTMGLAVADFALPISVVKGQVITGDVRKKGAARFAKPFTVNDGQGDFGSIVIDVGDPEMKLSIGRKQKLLQKVKLNPVLATQLGSLASVIFTDATAASGLLDVTVAECNGVRLLDLMNKQATASFVYSVHDLKLDGPVPSGLSQVLSWGSQGIVGDIDSATLDLKKGVAYQNMTIALQKQTETKNAVGEKVKETTNETLKFKGGVDLATNKFKDYKLTIAPGLLLRDWRKSFPDGAEVELKGKVNDITSILVQAVGQLAVKGYGGNAVDKLLGELGGKKKKE